MRCQMIRRLPYALSSSRGLTEGGFARWPGKTASAVRPSSVLAKNVAAVSWYVVAPGRLRAVDVYCLRPQTSTPKENIRMHQVWWICTFFFFFITLKKVLNTSHLTIFLLMPPLRLLQNQPHYSPRSEISKFLLGMFRGALIKSETADVHQP